MGFNVRAKHRSEHPRTRFMRVYQPSILGVTKLAVKSENELLKHGGNIWGYNSYYDKAEVTGVYGDITIMGKIMIIMGI